MAMAFGGSGIAGKAEFGKEPFSFVSSGFDLLWNIFQNMVITPSQFYFR
jgi:hypothetical protein